MRQRHGGVAQGAVFGIIAVFLLQFRIVQIAVLGLIAYLCGTFLYSQLIEQSTAPVGSYEMRVINETPPDLHFSRQAPKFGVDVQLTNSGPLLIRRWVLQTNLYSCPLDSSPIDACQLVQERGQWMTQPVRPGETASEHEDVTFFDVAPEGALRIVYSTGRVVADRDSEV